MSLKFRREVMASDVRSSISYKVECYLLRLMPLLLSQVVVVTVSYDVRPGNLLRTGCQQTATDAQACR